MKTYECHVEKIQIGALFQSAKNLEKAETDAIKQIKSDPDDQTWIVEEEFTVNTVDLVES